MLPQYRSNTDESDIKFCSTKVKKLLERKHRWNYNIKVVVTEVG
jgi:hypothetical protein